MRELKREAGQTRQMMKMMLSEQSVDSEGRKGLTGSVVDCGGDCGHTV